MGDGGCAVLSSRHPLAEFCNSEPRRRGHLKRKHRNWEAELGLVRVKEHSENASPHDHRSSSWPPVLVSDMELGSFLQVGDTAVEGNDKQSRRQHSRWDVRAEVMADKNSILHGAASCEPKTCDSEVVGSLPEQVGTVTEALAKEHAKESCLKKVRVVNDDCEQHKFCSKNRHYRHEHSSMISEVTCIDSSRSGNAECASLSSQVTITKSFTSGNDGLSARKTDSIVKCDTLFQSEDRASLNSPTDSRRGSNPPHSSIESRLQCLDYVSEYSLDDSRQGGRSRNFHSGVLHYNRRSKKENKSRQSENESTPSASRSGSRVVDPVEGSRQGISTSDSYISRDEPVLGHKEKGSSGHHRREKSPCESRLSSRQEKSGDHDKERGSGGHHRKEKSPCENRASSRQEKSVDYRRHDHVNNQEKCRDHRRNDSFDNYCQLERDSHSSGHHRRETSPGETRRKSRQEEPSVQRMTDSDGSAFRSLLSEKSRLSSLGKDAVSGTGDRPTGNSSGEVGAADVKQHIEEFSLDAKDNPEDQPGHYQAQSAIAGEEELWHEELDVPMDLSPAPAEDNASSSHVMYVETVDPGFIEHFVTADNSFHEDPDGRGWVYLDTEGVTQGPSSLFVLKNFMREGRLQSDHMVQLDGTNLWSTLEHAGLTQEGLGETFMLQTSSNVIVQGISHPCSRHIAGDNTVPVFLSSICEFPEDLNIDNRVDRLMQGFTLVPGKEEEVIVEALNHASRQNRPEAELELEDEDTLNSRYHQVRMFDGDVCKSDYCTQAPNSKEVFTSTTFSGSLDNSVSQSLFQSSRMWTCRGGDWKLMFQMDASAKAIPGSGRPEKLVLNRGKPLCTRTYGRLSDPRRGSVLYGVTNSRRLELPIWAYPCLEAMGATAEKSLNTVPATFISTHRSQVATPKDSSFSEASKKPKLDKVSFPPEQKLDESIIITSCEVASTQCHLPFVSVESCHKDEGRPSSLVGQDLECSHIQLERQEVELAATGKVSEESIKSVRQVPRRSDLMLETGEWFYQDGNGQQVGPYTFLELQTRIRDGLLYEGSSVYRKSDETWVPLFTNKSKERSSLNLAGDFLEGDSKQALLGQEQKALLDFHELYPQFIGFMCGRLHEHVMKSYRTRDFAAMVDEGSKSCFGDKKLSLSGSALVPSPYAIEQKDVAMGRMRSLLEVEDGRTPMGAESGGWSMIDFRMLMKIFRFLEKDLKSLVLASLTCKSWRAALSQFKREITQIDFSSLGSLCSDDIFRSFTEHAQNVSTVSLRGCTMLTPSAVKAFLQGSRSVESIDAKGCEQLKELIHQFSFSRPQPGGSESHHKLKDMKSLGDRKGTSLGRHSLFLDDWKGKKLNFSNDHVDGVTEPMDCDIPPYFQQNLEASHGVSSNDFKRQKLLSTGKLIKVGADSYYSKSSYQDARDKEHFDRKHKQSSIFSSRVSEAIAHILFKGESFEKDMSLVLQCVKDLKIPFNKEVASVRCRVELTKVEDKLRRGSYAETSIGLRAFKSDLFDVARKLFRLKEFDAGNDIFTITFRLTKQLLHEWKGRDTLDSKPFKRKSEELKSSSSLSSRKRGIGNAIREHVIGKRRKSHDESSEEDESEYNYASKSETSGTDEEDDYLSQDEKDEASAESDSEVETESEEEGKVIGVKEPLSEDETDSRIWGARMTKASMVPPETRKYELIEEYVIVADADEVEKRMGVNLPEDYDKMMQAQEDRGIEYSHLEMPELREFKPRKHVYEEVMEQEVYGIDPYTHNLLIDSMPASRVDFPDARRHQVIEEDILKALNQEVRQFTGTGKAPTKYLLESAVNRAFDECRDPAKKSFLAALAKNMRGRRDNHMKDTYIAYRKGLGVVCNHASGFDKDEFIVEFFGEVYPAWRWFEKQDAIRFFQKKEKDPAPEFYNIFLERPKGDASGYDLVVVDAMHKANYASRICHSCRPNCEARVTAVNGRYQIGVYTLRPVEYGEELTFDYNSITESKEEHEKSTCLCGSHVCRGSYLNFAGPDTFQEIMKEDHSLLHRHDLLLHACTSGSATAEDWDILKQAGLGSCLLDGLPGWTIKYAAGVVRFVNEEKKFLPREILKSILSERKLERAGESEAFEAEIQADGVFNTRLQNLAITLDKVRYVFKKLYGNPAVAPPPLRILKPMEVVALIWKQENSVVADLLHGMSQHISKEDLLDFKRRVREHEPSQIGNIEKNLQQSLIWLRDELCKAPITCASRHDGAADLIHMYAYTKLFFTFQDYPTFESPPLTISPLDLGPKHAHKLGAASSMEWTKTYSKDYVLGQLIFWYKPNVAEPGASLAKASKGCLSLPDPLSCYAKSSQQRLVYGSMDRLRMLRRLEHKPSRPWSWKGQVFWESRNNRQLLGSPMMDSIHQGSVVNREMMDWLRKRTRTIEGLWDN